MAESAFQETEAEALQTQPVEQDEPTWREPTTAVAKKLASMSDRAIQRVTGGNAFLRGRLYARRKAVDNLEEKETSVSGEISVRTSEDPYRTSVAYDDEADTWESSCTCPGWRGPTGHCKHVAAVMVALRDEVRPPRAKQPQQQPKKKKKKTEPIHVPGTVSVGGKRRRSRRRRRGGGGDAGTLEVLSPRELQAGRGESRGPMDAWLPPEALARPLDFEYRMTVRPASITVTPVLAGSRSAVPINDALSAFNMVSIDERPLFRALARNANRGQSTTAELRGEDAAEVLEMLSDRRVLLEPASMELRFANEALKPKIELDPANGNSLRVRVVFGLESNGRRFALSNGAWFEGTPGWQIDTTEGVARPVSELVTPAWLQRLYRSPAMVESLEALPALLGEYIPRIAASLGAELPDLSSVADLVDAKPHFELKANGDIIDARVRLLVRYEDQEFDVPPDDFPSPLAFLPPHNGNSRPRVVRRDVGAEMAGVQALMSQGFEVSESGEELVAQGDDALNFWTVGIGELPEEWDRFIPDDLVDVTIRDESVTPQMRVSSGVDWLNLDMTFESGGAVVREEELRACLEHGRRLVRLEDGTFAPVDPDKVGDVLTRMAEIYATGGVTDKLPLSQAGRVQDLLKMVQNARVSSSAKSLFSKIEDIDEIPSIPKPRTLKATLRPYQKDGFNWLVFLHEINSGGILADDMGLGKTVQAIALLTWAKGKYKRKLNLVVAPTSVVPNWEREIHKFAPGLTTVVWQGPNRQQRREDLEKADVMITSYALLRRDEELLHDLDLRYVILDEAQHIKNPMSHTARAAKKIKSERRLALTGTPIENRLSELWSIFDFVSPGLLGQLRTFEERIARPIDRGDMETAQRLRATIKPFVMRRVKQDVAADLPEKIEQEMIVPLAEEQAKLYKQILRQVRKSVLSEVEKQGVSRAQIQILAALTRLRQVACDPRLMKLPDTDFTAAESGKLAALREIVSEAVDGGHRVLVFSQFVEMLNHIRAALDEDDVEYEYLDGSTRDRIERVDRFNEDDTVPVFLISLKAGGTGLNLTGADTVVHFDPWWNPAVEDQATDRAHRIGQKKNVNVYKLIAEGTVEEKILELSAKKRELVSNVLSTEGSPLKGLTKADVENLFSE
ncbi:MAG: SNF2-related protein [Myxococcales bacterium]|nr:SNF2-related protein [Myxococcales bacterium]MDH3483661.1 SNF2-related protein [Myxococcales bacterium]